MSEKGCGGHVCNCSPNSTIARNPINVSPPVQCRTCKGQFYKFIMPGHPDDGEVFSCSVMTENMKETGDRPFYCSWRQAPEIAPIIDAEKEQKKGMLYYVGTAQLDAPEFTGGVDYR